MLVTLGGASVGDHDLVQKALVAAGMELGFWRIAMRPGKPLMHGRLGGNAGARPAGQPDLVHGLRDPVPAPAPACPARRAQRGRRPEPRPPASPSTCPPTARAGLYALFAWRDADGALVGDAGGMQDSSLVKVMARADGLIVRPPRAAAAKAGDSCCVIPFEGLGYRTDTSPRLRGKA